MLVTVILNCWSYNSYYGRLYHHFGVVIHFKIWHTQPLLYAVFLSAISCICNWKKTTFFSGTYPLIYVNPWSFYMQIHYMRTYFWSPYLSHITWSTCTYIWWPPQVDNISQKKVIWHSLYVLTKLQRENWQRTQLTDKTQHVIAKHPFLFWKFWIFLTLPVMIGCTPTNCSLQFCLKIRDKYTEFRYLW